MTTEYKYHVRVRLTEVTEMCASFNSFTTAARWARDLLATDYRQLIFEAPTKMFLMRSLINHDGSVHYLPLKEI